MNVAEREGELRRLLQDAAGAPRRSITVLARELADRRAHAAAAMGAAPPDDGAPLSLGDDHFDQSRRGYTFVKTPEEAAAMVVERCDVVSFVVVTMYNTA